VGKNGLDSGKTSEARKLLNQNNVPVCEVSITQRVAFTDALNGGESVNEFEPKSKASIEVERLLKWVNAETQK
jgi:cellulose biosynthesis protein BcsQ